MRKARTAPGNRYRTKKAVRRPPIEKNGFAGENALISDQYFLTGTNDPVIKVMGIVPGQIHGIQLSGQTPARQKEAA